MQVICEIMLLSEGFEAARMLAKKMTVLYKLAKEQLSKQFHYDFGLRALKSVLVMAGGLKRGSPDLDEAVVMMRALRDSNMPKFVFDDVPLVRAGGACARACARLAIARALACVVAGGPPVVGGGARRAGGGRRRGGRRGRMRSMGRGASAEAGAEAGAPCFAGGGARDTRPAATPDGHSRTLVSFPAQKPAVSRPHLRPLPLPGRAPRALRGAQRTHRERFIGE